MNELAKQCYGRARKVIESNVRCGILHQAETTGGWKLYLCNFSQQMEKMLEFLEGIDWSSGDI